MRDGTTTDPKCIHVWKFTGYDAPKVSQGKKKVKKIWQCDRCRKQITAGENIPIWDNKCRYIYKNPPEEESSSSTQKKSAP
jgi:ribosomal protein L37AE/L43A